MDQFEIFYTKKLPDSESFFLIFITLTYVQNKKRLSVANAPTSQPSKQGFHFSHKFLLVPIH